MQNPDKVIYSGYGYHGGGRKKKKPEDKAVYKTMSICGKPEEIQQLKNNAAKEKKSVSRYIIESLT